MVFKEMVAYLLDGKGGYTCSNDIQAEKKLYEVMLSGVQEGIDGVRERHPDWSEERLHQYAVGDSIGQTMLKAKECLESHGYDTSTLPHYVVPEFGDVATLVLRIGMGAAIMGGIYAANRFKNKINYKL